MGTANELRISVSRVVKIMERYSFWSGAIGKRFETGCGVRRGINVWLDKWLLDVCPKAPLKKSVVFDLDLQVCDLISQPSDKDLG